MTTSQDWWPADYGHYGPLFIRMTWHAAGTYRIADGRGGGGEGAQRFAPLNSWPDNANLDKARRLLWPIKQKYGRKISWADLLVYAGNVAMDSMGFKTFGFGFGRPDIWEPEEIFWGPEDTWLGDERHGGEGDIQGPFGADHMGLIYVNPEGPGGNPDPAPCREIHPANLRPHGDERRGDGCAHRRWAHIRQDPRCRSCAPNTSVPNPRASGLEEQGFGWRSSFGSGKGAETITSGLEGAWTNEPTKWDNGFLENLYKYDWELTTSPPARSNGRPTNREAQGTVPDAHDPSKRHAPMMLTTDLALKTDPIYAADHQAFPREPGPARRRIRARRGTSCCTATWAPSRGTSARGFRSRRFGRTPSPRSIMNSSPRRTSPRSSTKLLASGLSISQLVSTAWSSAATFRGTDKRGGANGARIRLAPQKDWEVNDPAELAKVLQTLERIQKDFNRSQTGGKRVSLADLIVLGGCAAVEQAAKNAGHDVTVPFTPGRTDASQEQTDVAVVRRARTDFRRIPQLPPRRRAVAAGDAAGGAGFHADFTRSADDGSRRRTARAQR